MHERTRLFWLFLAGGVVIGGVAVADPFGGVPHTFQADTVISASQMNANFESIHAYIDTLEARLSASNAALDAVEARLAALEGAPALGLYRGSTAATSTRALQATGPTGDTLTGYAAAKRLCELKLGTPTAHMCTADEMVRSAQLGITPSISGYISTGVATSYVYSGGTVVATNRDCWGWTSNSGNTASIYWGDPSVAGPGVASCDNPFPLHCCD